MRLSIVTINYNGAHMTIRLLKSLQAQNDHAFETIVVDNASLSEDLTRLKDGLARVHSVTLLENKENFGFAGGNNMGIKKALTDGADWILLINNDAYVDQRFIAGARAFMSCRGGVVTFPIKEGERTAYCGLVRWLTPRGWHAYDQKTALVAQKESRAYAIGAGMAIHSSVFEKIGYLDDRYFLYFEDEDFSVRALKAGIPIEIAPHAVNHDVSSTTGKLGTPLLLRYHWRNALLFNWKNGPLWVCVALPFWSFFAIIKQVFKIIFMPSTRAYSRAILAGIFDFYAGKFGKI